MMTEERVAMRSWQEAEAEVYASMGYGTAQPEADIRHLAETLYAEALRVARPRIMYELRSASLLPRRQVATGEVIFSPGGIIGSYLDGMTEICVFVATAGTEYEDFLHHLKDDGDIVSEFVADAIGSVVAEHCVDYLDQRLRVLSPLPHSLPYSPGYCGWDIVEQRLLFSLFPPHPCGVRLTDSCLMSPVKSVSGFFALGEHLRPQPYRCQLCTNIHCYKRKNAKR